MQRQESFEMNKILVSAAVATLLLSGTGAALAQDAMSADTPMDFTALDTDANGTLSLVEAQVAWPDLTQEQFEAADTDHDGALSEDEANGLKATMGGDESTVPSEDDDSDSDSGASN
jgi:hypothetical protein